MIGLKALMERARLMARRIEYDGRELPGSSGECGAGKRT